jgi:hypothetical protein
MNDLTFINYTTQCNVLQLYLHFKITGSIIEYMTLPTLPKRDKRTETITVRITKDALKQLNALKERHNLSQADVIELLVSSEYKKVSNEKSGRG